MNKLLVIIGGPTASGKTRLAIDLALHFQTEIISADSRQFYRELTIGTAKPSALELQQVPHHFINSHSVSQPVTISTYETGVRNLLDQLFAIHDVVIMAGGSGLYIDAVIHGIDELPEADKTVRAELERVFESDGLVVLQEQLKQLDPEAYQTIDIQNPRRLIRALEVCRVSGVAYSSLLGKKQPAPSWQWMIAGMDWPREKLYERINERTRQMITAGLKKEAESVIAYRKENALSTVGYKEMFDHLDGLISLEETELLIAQHTRNYAKRQLTWFRRYDEMTWIQPGEEEKLVRMIEEKLK